MIRRPSVLLSFAVAALGVLAACSGTSPTSSSASSSTEGIAARGSVTDAAATADASAAAVAKVRIAGSVAAVLVLNQNGDSRFRVKDKTLPKEYTVVARRGYTTIRQGFARRSVGDVTLGKGVHVAGDWLPSPAPAAQSVLAKSITLQVQQN